MDCIFCKIVSGELPCAKVYEDDEHIAILDLFPVSKGHTLLIPKKHHVNIFDGDEELAGNVYLKLTKLARAIRTATGCVGMNLVQNNEVAAGQVVFHSHIHLIPRWDNDGLIIAIASKAKADNDYLKEISEGIKRAIAK